LSSTINAINYFWGTYQTSIFTDSINEEHFMSEINFTMNESLNRFFGITDKDIEDFNNIKISDDN
jgi:hypothetical protein